MRSGDYYIFGNIFLTDDNVCGCIIIITYERNDDGAVIMILQGL